jgi:DNA (cytosine-5)-methyltransferase 1
LSTHRIIDLFCGTGGFAQGFVDFNDDFEIVAAVDLLPEAIRTTKANHPACLAVADDVRNVRPSVLQQQLRTKEIDIIIGGPPCQGFSSLRPFRSSTEDDPRNSLFEQFALYVNYFRPKCFVMENVVGLLTHEKGHAIERVQQCFYDIGYTTEWKVLNAANFGVPQKRERLIMIGAQRGEKIRFPAPTHSFNGKTIGFRDRSKIVRSDAKLPRALSVMDAIGDLPELPSGGKATAYEAPPQNQYQEERRRGSETLTLHEAANHAPYMLEIIKHSGESIRCIPPHLISSGFSSCYSRLDPDEPSATITVKFTSPSSSKCIHPFQDRAITPREAARIQSFDDWYVFAGSKTQVATMIGNAVPPLLGKAVASAVASLLGMAEAVGSQKGREKAPSRSRSQLAFSL